ncbi:MAG: hypothetical protein P8M67_06805, partial [Opitutales bacterium]|nr:hypothetical protein [Opitutales bacterium]
MGNLLFEHTFAPVLASADIFSYFVDSNMAGKAVIFLLAILNCWAISIMLSKNSQLKRIRSSNGRDEKKINELPNMLDYE